METVSGLLHENGLEIYSENEKIVIEFRIEEDCPGSKADFEQTIGPDSSQIPYTPIIQIEHNGLCGHSLYFHSGKEDVFEARFDLESDMEAVFIVATVLLGNADNRFPFLCD